jgi:hypothetical protein
MREIEMGFAFARAGKTQGRRKGIFFLSANEPDEYFILRWGRTIWLEI